MKSTRQIVYTLYLSFFTCITLQSQDILESNPDNWEVVNREVIFENGVVHLNAQEGDGILWLKDHAFKDGTIALDIKGKNTPGRSFVGFAFHGLDNTTYDAVYFRPFNFKNPSKKSNSVQYISEPEYGWYTLRNKFPGTYEGAMEPLPKDVEDWFHVKIIVEHPKVKVYINSSENPVLVVDQLSDRKKGNLGFWVGNNSKGWFRNLTIREKK
ncbi:MAG: family 16 glycoside hydrolase [Bacteroidota bacterium]